MNVFINKNIPEAGLRLLQEKGINNRNWEKMQLQWHRGITQFGRRAMLAPPQKKKTLKKVKISHFYIFFHYEHHLPKDRI